MCLVHVSISNRMKLFTTLSPSALKQNSLLSCPWCIGQSLGPKGRIKNQLCWSRHYTRGFSGTFLRQNCWLRSGWSRFHNDPRNLYFLSTRWIFPYTPIEKSILRLQTIPDLIKDSLEIHYRVPQTCF